MTDTPTPTVLEDEVPVLTEAGATERDLQTINELIATGWDDLEIELARCVEAGVDDVKALLEKLRADGTLESDSEPFLGDTPSTVAHLPQEARDNVAPVTHGFADKTDHPQPASTTQTGNFPGEPGIETPEEGDEVTEPGDDGFSEVEQPGTLKE